MHRPHDMTRAAVVEPGTDARPARAAGIHDGSPVPVGQRPHKPLRAVPRLTLPSGLTLPPRRSDITALALAGTSPDRSAIVPVASSDLATTTRDSLALSPEALRQTPATDSGIPLKRTRTGRTAPLFAIAFVVVAGGLLLGRTVSESSLDPLESDAVELVPDVAVPSSDEEPVPAGLPRGDENVGTGDTVGSGAGEIAGPVAAENAGVDVDALVLENRELAEQVETLETETTGLQGELLSLELRVVALSAASPEASDDNVTDIVIVGDAEDSVEESAEASGGDLQPGAPAWENLPPEDFALEGPLPGAPPSMASSSDAASSDALASDAALPGAPFGSDLRPGGGVESGDAATDAAIASASSRAPVERLVVTETPSGSVAESAGFLPGDVLLEIDDTAVDGFADILPYDDGMTGHLHEVTVLREGQRLQLVLGETPTALSLHADWFDPEILGL